jgi:hypothetical protein
VALSALADTSTGGDEGSGSLTEQAHTSVGTSAHAASIPAPAMMSSAACGQVPPVTSVLLVIGQLVPLFS